MQQKNPNKGQVSFACKNGRSQYSDLNCTISQSRHTPTKR